MDQKRWQKIEDILDEALTLDSPKERDIFVNCRCKSDDELYQEITLLLKSIEKAEKNNFLLEN